MRRKAPNLQTLRIKTSLSDQISLASHRRPLFSDAAPRLKHFTTNAKFIFNPTAPWISNLRTISLETYHPIPFILSLLKSTPLLTTLKLSGVPPSDIHQHAIANAAIEELDLTPIHLPRLTSLQLLYSPFRDVLTLLTHIKPSSCCGLVIFAMGSTGTRANTRANSLVDDLYDVMVEWISAFIDGRPAKSLVMTSMLCAGMPSFTIQDAVAIKERSLEVTFNLEYRGYSALRKLATCSGLSTVKQLCLDCVPETGDKLLPLYRAFSSVTNLIIVGRCDDIRSFHIDDNPWCQFPIFPLLHTLEVRGSRNYPIQRFNSVGFIIDFLEYRAGVGLPVLSLNLCNDTAMLLRREKQDCLRRLRQVSGLVLSMPPTAITPIEYYMNELKI
ncbi:hypothetical protein D9613_011851 [Agrocybe pediades]|uniref:Uncharacterized protein n=1 Tax=Agrocybe pediades TaxID=84607 RepID=A0A8H4VIW9_9AGAR|nr:hypothetical protein D9613_011851 [Agrocybe pediades]